MTIDFESAPSSFAAMGRRKPYWEFADPPDSPSPGSPRKSSADYLLSLNDRQREAALITEGPLIVLAGAGSGKTKMLTTRISYLIDQLEVPAHQILAVTFTNKAAGEMRERVEKTLSQAFGGSYLGQPEIGTFHSVCVRLLRREITRTPFEKPFVIYDDSDQLSLIKGVFSKLGIDEKSINPKAIQGVINRMKCDASEPQDIEPASHNVFERHLKRVYEQYQRELIANSALDFGEIICMTYRLLRDHEDIRQKYQKRFRYVHVDEYQDTNRSQYLLLSMLAGADRGGHGNICVVGDEDQSIYKWRGADIRNILDFERDYPGAQIVKLEQNYRSTKNIIRAASDVISRNTSRKDKRLWTENEEGPPIVRVQLADERSEAEIAIAEVKRIAEADGRAFNEFAIFYRTNAQSRQFEDVLRREKIPYQIVGGLRFYDRREIKDVLSYFKVVLNPSDSVSLKRIINVPGRGIGKTTIEKIDEQYALLGTPEDGMPTVSWWEVLCRVASDSTLVSAGTAKKLGGFVSFVQRLIDEQPKLKLSELYHLILDETGYVRELRKEATEEALARIENLEEFDTLLQEFEEDCAEQVQKSDLLPLFIEQTTLASDTDQLDSFAGNVKLMTLHSSKGLEFPVVFMAGMEEGLFPSIKPWQETPEEEIEEERRLCYVGMTRARERLYMMNVVMRRIWGNTCFHEPSRFFLEMPDDLIEFRDFSRRIGGGFSSQPRMIQGGRQDFGRSGNSSDSSMRDRMRVVPDPGTEMYRSGQEVVGKKLDHPEYGPGTIIAAEGLGDDQKITVEFHGRERRKFLAKYLRTLF